jgi:hypothetical protein
LVATHHARQIGFATGTSIDGNVAAGKWEGNLGEDGTAWASDSSNENAESKVPWVRYASIFAAVVIVAVIAMAVVFGVCGTSGCRSKSNGTIAMNIASSSNTGAVVSPTNQPTAAPTLRPTLPPTTTPTASPTDSRKADLVEYINNITLSGRIIAQPDPMQDLNELAPEELALYWIIQRDPLQLTPDSAASQFRIRQRYALKTFWVQLSADPFFGRTGDECTWNFVTCSSMDLGGEIGVQDVVTGLEVRDAVRGGYLTADLGLLSSLSTVDFTNIGLVSTLPESIGRWTDATYVAVQINNLTGTLPSSIGSWNIIREFSLNDNSFTGTLPLSMSRWSAIEEVWLWGNALRGTIPSFVGEWKNLRFFNIFDNAFSGSLPESIGQLTSLEVMYLDNNRLSGTVPSSVGVWTQLVNLSLAENSFPAPCLRRLDSGQTCSICTCTQTSLVECFLRLSETGQTLSYFQSLTICFPVRCQNPLGNGPTCKVLL